MATFIPGVTDYIPQFQNDIPDLGLIQQTLKIKQSQYDANYAKIKSIQDSLLNAKLSRDDTKETRKAFMEAADKAIKQISTVDLSKPQNVSVAERIFDPLINNQLFLKDVAATKIAAAELQKGYDARECADPKKCNDGYNPESEEAINYWLENFKNMTPEEALKANPIRYVYDPKVSEKLLAYVKEIAPDGEVSEIAGTGEYIITTKMGQKVQEKLNTLLQSMIANDPQVAEYFTNKASVARERYVRSTATPESGISREQANKQYDTEKIAAIQKAYTTNINTLEEYIKNKEEESNALAARYGNKITEGSSAFKELEERAALIKQYRTFKNNVETKKLEFDNNVQKGLSSAFIDNNYADQLLESSVSAFTEGYAAQKYSRKIEANDIWLNERKFEQDVYLKEIDFNNQMALEREKARLEGVMKQWELDSGYAGGKGGKGSAKGKKGEEEEREPKLVQIKSGAGSASATRNIDFVNEENVKLLVQQQEFANGGKLNYLLELSNGLDEKTRNIIFAKPGGGVYSTAEIENLIGPNGLQRVPNKPEKSMLDVLYKLVTERMSVNPITNNIPAEVFNYTAKLQSQIDDAEKTVKAGLDVVSNNKRNVFASLQKDYDYLQLIGKLRNNPDLARLVKAEKHDGNNIQVVDEVAMNKIANQYETLLNAGETTSYGGVVVSDNPDYYKPTNPGESRYDRILKVNAVKNRALDNLKILKDLQSLLTKQRSNPNVRQIPLNPTNYKLDELGGTQQFAIPAVGYNEMVLNTSSSEATSNVTDFFRVINNKLEGNESIIIKSGDDNDVPNDREIINYLASLYQNPDENNPEGILGIARANKLNEENEYSENSVTYTITLPGTLQKKMRTDLGKDNANMSVPTVIRVTMPAEVDSELAFSKNAINIDPITTYMNIMGNYSKEIKNPRNPNNKVEIKLYKNANKDIIAETYVDGVRNPGNTINLTQNDKQPSDFINQQYNYFFEALGTYTGNVQKASGSVETGKVYSISDLQSMGLIFK